MLGCRPADTPVEANVCLSSQTGEPVDKGQYQRLVGKLIYLSHTRPDITFAVTMVSQFMHDPYSSHWEAVIRILRYLKAAPGKGVLFSPHSHLRIEAFIDSQLASSPDDRCSTSGYCTLVGGNLVTWRSKKQTVVARSSAEAEFRAMSHGICELMWIKGLLQDLAIDVPLPMMLYCDNKYSKEIQDVYEMLLLDAIEG
ncbi:secreted RxLR effector protein 161-like [Telopea speciosissima]|uniref:secreted RxLR effector protein 161-like n=1 Tax=Telopea speciosissima TaxID=54955 RepID=UPI001CC5C239|nr:secreted RxLR effector protein 161-like [Telopea speciosissima]